MTTPEPLARCAVRVALVPAQGRLGELDYALPAAADATIVGTRVLVPLGNRRATGIVVGVTGASERGDLREVLSVMDSTPLFDAGRLALCRWMADYYVAAFGEVLAAALPGSLRFRVERIARRSSGCDGPLRDFDRRVFEALERRGGEADVASLRAELGAGVGRSLQRLAAAGILQVEERVARESAPVRTEEFVSAGAELDEKAAEALRRRPAVRRLFEHIRTRDEPVSVRLLRADTPGLRPKLRLLDELGLVRLRSVEVAPDTAPPCRPEPVRLRLTAEQISAVASISATMADGGFAPFLLLGVTGSGKTEVYLHSIDECLRRNAGALVLVPEISLTHQLVARVRARFGDRVSVLHSGLSDAERWDAWRRLARGENRIAVGARSAVFAPVRDLGLIVVDEEHDGAYKQEDGIRYNGRDVAVMRAKLAGCPVILGSATPSMESYENGRRGRYRLLELRDRVEGRPLPEVEVVDLRRRIVRSDQGVPVSPEIEAALQANHAAHGQSLVFLNRRGFANFLQCSLCGETLMCPNCSVALTLHLRQRLLRCHHCDHRLAQPSTCPACGEAALKVWGAGTERVERILREIVPGARIGRMDRDTTSRRGAQREILRAWEARELDILVGTQMITKGHDVPGVTFVGVLLADQSLNFPDFRAAERTFQLLTQVAGRAGRGDRAGRVIVQTFQPWHYSLRRACTHDFRGFAEDELRHRQETGYPPFGRLVLVRCEALDAGKAEAVARSVREHVRRESPVQVLGPAPAPLQRVRGRYQWQLLLRSRSGNAVRRAAAAARDAVRDTAKRAGVRLVVDVDPYSMM